MAALAARLMAAAEAVGAVAPGRLDAARGAAVVDGGGAQAEAPGLAVGAYASRIARLSASRSMASRPPPRPCGRAAGVLSRTGPRLRAARPTMSRAPASRPGGTVGTGDTGEGGGAPARPWPTVRSPESRRPAPRRGGRKIGAAALRVEGLWGGGTSGGSVWWGLVVPIAPRKSDRSRRAIVPVRPATGSCGPVSSTWCSGSSGHGQKRSRRWGPSCKRAPRRDTGRRGRGTRLRPGRDRT